MQHLIFLASIESVKDTIEIVFGVISLAVCVYCVGLLIYDKILRRRIDKCTNEINDNINDILELHDEYVKKSTECADDLYHEIKSKIDGKSEMTEEDITDCLSIALMYLNIPLSKSLEELQQACEAEIDHDYEVMMNDIIECSEESRKRALEMLRYGLKAERAEAYQMMGDLYVLGVPGEEAIPRDFGKARENYMRAAELGDNTAMYRLGVMCSNGIAGEASAEEARSWMKKATEAGNEEAKKWLNIDSVVYQG